MPVKLEHPGEGGASDSRALYLARGDDVNPNRPLFTGDVYVVSGERFQILQHPCALRLDGVALVDNLLAARVTPFARAIDKGTWRGNYRLMPLPELHADNSVRSYAASFTDLLLISSDALGSADRMACLSQIGVNLLLQRWVHHNSRVVVPTFQYQEVTSGPLEECDLIEEWSDDSPDEPLGDRWMSAHDWLRTPTASGKTRQSLLEDPQNRAKVRREMREFLRNSLRHNSNEQASQAT